MKSIRFCAYVFLCGLIVSGSACHLRKGPNQEVISPGESDSDGSADLSVHLTDNGNLSSRVLIEEARTQACSAAKQYMTGEYRDARSNLQAALLNLQLADLPQDMQKIGFFQPYLPDDCNKVDLQKVYDNLEDMAKKEEFDVDETVMDVSADGFPKTEQQYIAAEIFRLMQALGEEPVKSSELDVFVTEVEGFVNYLLTDKRDWFQRSYHRMMKYRETVEKVFAEKKLPLELRYLALVESGYNFSATSRAQARGIWQFISSTGKIYELKISRGIDERLDPVKATIAAREYFLDLIAIFGSKSFLLAMASYNAGEGKIQKCLRQLEDPFEDRSFWQIRDCLRQETRDYIPLIIAAAILSENPKRFGLDLPSYEEIRETKGLVICPVRIRLSQVAELAGISLDELKELNPDLPTGSTWTPVNNIHLWVPKPVEDKINVAMVSHVESNPAPVEAETPESPQMIPRYHVVKKGETLSKIGRLYHLDYKQIANWNNLKSPYSLSLGQKLMIGSYTASDESASSHTICGNSLVYIVQKGNYIAGIASMFGVTARDVMRANRLSRGTIHPGQKLTICPAFPVEIIRHKVSSKETLFQIAKKYRVEIEDVIFCNGIAETETIQQGTELIIYRKA